jgi:Domain of unknown function (DUF4386)
MSMFTRATSQQRVGGVAALYLGAALLLAMPFFLVVVDYPAATGAAEKVVLLAEHHAAMHGMYLISYVVFGVALAVLALALHARLRTAAPALITVATAVGLMWAVVLVASGMVFNAGMAAVVELHLKDPDQAAATWQAIEPVAQGLGSGAGGEFLGGLWVLLVSIASLRSRSLPRPLTWLGLAVGSAGLLSILPPLAAGAYLFGLLSIGWLGWLGIALMRTPDRPDAMNAPAPQPLAMTTGR